MLAFMGGMHDMLVMHSSVAITPRCISVMSIAWDADALLTPHIMLHTSREHCVKRSCIAHPQARSTMLAEQ